MKRLRTSHVAVLATGLALGAGACGKKSKTSADDGSSSTTSSTGGGSKTINENSVPEDEIIASEDAAVDIATGKLQVAGSLNLLSAKSSTTLALSSPAGAEVALKLAEDRKVYLRVSNEAFEAIDQAASILCFVSQTKFWEQANQGVYRALIDSNECDEKRGGGGSGGGGGEGGGSGSSSSQGQKSYVPAYVKATRVDGKPLIAEIRFDMTEKENEGALYHAKVIVLAPPSDNYPAGLFRMEFVGRSASGEAMGGGFISMDKAKGRKFVLRLGDKVDRGEEKRDFRGVSELEKVDGSSDYRGAIHSNNEETHSEGSRKNLAQVKFDASYVNVKGSSSSNYGGQAQESSLDGCFDRNQFKTAIFRYDVVGADGKTLPLNSAFQAEYEKNGKTYFANVSYWGLWVQGDMTPESGETIYKVEWNGNKKVRTPYTVYKAAGKLVKLSKSSKKLGEIKGVDLSLWSEGSSYVVRWDGTKLAKVGKVTYSDNEMTEEEASGDVEIERWGLHLFVSSLNANINIPYGASLSDDYEISYHSEVVVSGTDDLPTGNLVCFDNCPVMNPSASAFEQNQNSQQGPSVSDLYVKTQVNWGQVYDTNRAANVTTALATYTFDGTNQVLRRDGTAFALPSGLSSDGEDKSPKSVRSGALIPESAWQAISDKSSDPYAVQQSLDVYYMWMSGTSSWDSFVSMKSEDGKFVKFDRPMEFSYVHSKENDFDGIADQNVVGKPYRLTYAGPGQLWGIPWKFNKSVAFAMPLFSIKAGTKLGDYSIYPVEGDQRMAKVDSAKCSALNLSEIPPLFEKFDPPGINFTEGNAESQLKYIGGSAI